MKILRAALRVISLLALALGAASLCAEGQTDGTPVGCGIHRTLFSKTLNEERTLLVRLPAGYETSDKTYPVLYVLDGDLQVLLRACSAVSYLAEMTDKAPEHIVIGIENTSRGRDMVPGPGADRFAQFLRSELIPFVEQSYRTNGFDLVSGQSLSAVFGFYAYLKSPETFDGYVLASFGLSDDWRRLFESELERSPCRSAAGKRYLFVSNGGEDPYDPDGVRTKNGAAFMESHRKAAPANVLLEYRVYADEGHVPFPTIYDALRWIYSQAGATRE